jgi:aspartyl aminopeptidase
MSEEKNKNAWLKFGEKGKQDIFNFCEGYKNYMSVCKTERESVLEAIRLAEEKGYRDLNLIIKNGETLKSGDKVYLNNKDKALVLFLIGDDSIVNGMRIIGSHVDSPRLDLKQHTLYEDGQIDVVGLNSDYVDKYKESKEFHTSEDGSVYILQVNGGNNK